MPGFVNLVDVLLRRPNHLHEVFLLYLLPVLLFQLLSLPDDFLFLLHDLSLLHLNLFLSSGLLPLEARQFDLLLALASHLFDLLAFLHLSLLLELKFALFGLELLQLFQSLSLSLEFVFFNLKLHVKASVVLINDL